MNLLLWTAGQALGVLELVALVLATHVLRDALVLFHHAGLDRIHNDTSRSSR